MSRRVCGYLWCCVYLALLSQNAVAQSVTASASSREAYVGQPIVLTVTATNTGTYTTPDVADVDGLDITSLGGPSRSFRSQMDSSGRRTSSTSLTWKFQVTPRREGEFTIPPISFSVRGEEKQTEPISIIVTKSETDDLLFVEIEDRTRDDGNSARQVYVGQPVKLALKVWIRPFVEREIRVKLGAADMWSLASENSSWGKFQEKIDEMATRREIPAGKEVIRKDSNGDSRAYYLYEIESMVYPQRPGQIEVGDVQVVVNYPTELGYTRRTSIFGDDDLFRGFESMFSRGRRLAITKARPINVNATLPPIEVVDVPTEGRPADYRGAVGEYQMLVEAKPTNVKAGDPITLRIVLQGNGPMELVQPPPVSTVDSLTKNFKVADDSLAGYVQDDKKLFSTTIRPLREGVSEVPPIPFSFFNPQTETFETIYGDRVPITVAAAETLSLDEIVGSGNENRNGGSGTSESTDEEPAAPNKPVMHFGNFTAVQVMEDDRQISGSISWLPIVLPPLLVGLCWLIRDEFAILKKFRRTRSPLQEAIVRVSSASTPAEIVNAMRAAVEDDIPASIAPVIASCEEAAYSPMSTTSLEQLRTRAVESLKRLNEDQANMTLVKSTVAIFVACMFVMSVDQAIAADGSVELTIEQQRILIGEANELYSSVANEGVAAKNELLTLASKKYQLVADSGLQSAKLFFNLGNSYLQVGEVGKAIGNFEQAHRFSPGDRLVMDNLRFARSKLASDTSGASSDDAFSFVDTVSDLNFRQRGIAKSVFVVAWCGFWILLGLDCFSIRIPFLKPCAYGLAVVFFLAGASSLCSMRYMEAFDAVVVAKNAELHQGDGDAFPIIGELLTGQHVELTEERGNWLKIKSLDSSSTLEGWATNDSILRIR